jgi:hypothetical protein
VLRPATPVTVPARTPVAEPTVERSVVIDGAAAAHVSPTETGGDRGSRSRWPLILVAITGILFASGLAAAVLFIVGGGDDEKSEAARTSTRRSTTTSIRRPTTTTTRRTPRTAAALDLETVVLQLDPMLSTSEASRAKLNQTIIGPFTGCTLDAASAVAGIDTVIAERQALQRSIRALTTRTTDPTASDLLEQLSTALDYSIQSNQRYRAWFQANIGAACNTLGAAEKADGDLLGQQATNTKITFVAAYNPVARSYGLVPRDASKI